MKRAIKIRLIIIALIFVSVAGYQVYIRAIQFTATGQVLDCATNKPIDGANVSLGRIGWGIRTGNLVWDKLFTYESTTDNNGAFTIKYSGSPTHVIATKNGYKIADQWNYPNKPIPIKMMQGDEKDRSYYCKTPEECTKETNENGVTVFENICKGDE